MFQLVQPERILYMQAKNSVEELEWLAEYEFDKTNRYSTLYKTNRYPTLYKTNRYPTLYKISYSI